MIAFMQIIHDTQTAVLFDRIHQLTLIRYKKQPQDKGLTVKCLIGYTRGQYKLV